MPDEAIDQAGAYVLTTILRDVVARTVAVKASDLRLVVRMDLCPQLGEAPLILNFENLRAVRHRESERVLDVHGILKYFLHFTCPQLVFSYDR